MVPQSPTPTLPWVTSISVISCHLFIATNHLSPLFLQLRQDQTPQPPEVLTFRTHLTSTTNRSFPTTDETVCSLSNENFPSGNK